MWGAPDGCGYVFTFNNTKAPWNNADVRIAINYAIDRDQLSSLGYNSANYPEVAPFSTYMKERWLPGKLQAVIDKYDRNKRDLNLVAEHMQAAGYAKDANDMWTKDGQTLKIPVRGPQFFGPLAPPLTEQLKSAGFDATSVIEPDSSTAWSDDLVTGKSDTIFFVHCGSISEPLNTLQDLHSKNGPPVGQKCPSSIACTRYSNPEYDKLIDDMTSMVGSPDNPKYMDDAAAGARHLPPGHARDHAARGAARGRVQHHLLEGLAEREGSVRRAVPAVGSLVPDRQQDSASAIAPARIAALAPFRLRRKASLWKLPVRGD